MCSEKINTSKNRSTAPMKSNLKGFRGRERERERVEGRVEHKVFRADGGDVVFRGGGVVEKEEIE